MWLKYGVTPDLTLVTVDEVKKGKTNLTCPYCGGLLTAKKGKVKTHHFAHTDETCYPVAKKQVPSLPIYDNFNLHLSGQHFQEVKQLWREYGDTSYAIPPVPFKLTLAKIFEYDPAKDGYVFTDLGKIPVGGLPLAKFNEVQEPLILEQLDKLTFRSNLNFKSQHQDRVNLQLYRAQLRRILKLQLYFLQIKTQRQTLHKIGVTSRTMPERLAEIERDLGKYYKSFEIEILGTWQHRGNVELYFKHRYQSQNYRIGKLSEYYRFEDVQPVLDDLQQMHPKQLTQEELEVLHQDSYFDAVEH
jgi:hypothetical protein